MDRRAAQVQIFELLSALQAELTTSCKARKMERIRDRTNERKRQNHAVSRPLLAGSTAAAQGSGKAQVQWVSNADRKARMDEFNSLLREFCVAVVYASGEKRLQKITDGLLAIRKSVPPADVDFLDQIDVFRERLSMFVDRLRGSGPAQGPSLPAQSTEVPPSPDAASPGVNPGRHPASPQEPPDGGQPGPTQRVRPPATSPAAVAPVVPAADLVDRSSTGGDIVGALDRSRERPRDRVPQVAVGAAARPGAAGQSSPVSPIYWHPNAALDASGAAERDIAAQHAGHPIHPTYVSLRAAVDAMSAAAEDEVRARKRKEEEFEREKVLLEMKHMELELSRAREIAQAQLAKVRQRELLRARRILEDSERSRIAKQFDTEEDMLRRELSSLKMEIESVGTLMRSQMRLTAAIVARSKTSGLSSELVATHDDKNFSGAASGLGESAASGELLLGRPADRRTGEQMPPRIPSPPRTASAAGEPSPARAMALDDDSRDSSGFATTSSSSSTLNTSNVSSLVSEYQRGVLGAADRQALIALALENQRRASQMPPPPQQQQQEGQRQGRQPQHSRISHVPAEDPRRVPKTDRFK